MVWVILQWKYVSGEYKLYWRERRLIMLAPPCVLIGHRSIVWCDDLWVETGMPGGDAVPLAADRENCSVLANTISNVLCWPRHRVSALRPICGPSVACMPSWSIVSTKTYRKTQFGDGCEMSA